MTLVFKRGVAPMLVVAALAAGAIGCGSASEADSYVDDNKLIITWEGTGAGLYVTDLVAVAPDGYDEKVEGGTTFWGIEASSWPAGFSSPVTYGELPDGAKDVTEKNGGKKGGVPLEIGVRYKITIQGFGGDPQVQEIVWSGVQAARAADDAEDAADPTEAN